jgi:amidase
MPPKTIVSSSVTELALALRERSVSSEEIVSATLARLLEVNPLLNAAIRIAPESAIAQARAADIALGRGDAGPLCGIPFTVKDVYPVGESAPMIDAPGMPAAPGMMLGREATVVKRLRAAGAIPIGVTRATWWSDREERYGPAHNPYDLACEPGGSSGGEAALIAAGGSPLGLGSDSGGSLRIPAHYCGVATLRPSNGCVPRGVDAGGSNDPRTVAGPLARSIADLALVLPIIAGYDPDDPTTTPIPLRNSASVALHGLKVGFVPENGLIKPTPETADTVQRAAQALSAAGAHVVEIASPGMDEGWEITQIYWRYCGAQGDLKEYFAFLDRWDQYRCRTNRLMQSWDVLLCPVEAYPALRHDVTDKPLGCTYTAPFSLVGLPSAVVRAGTSADGLPIGVQIVAAPWRDDLALAAAHCIESACGGWRPSTILPGRTP